MAEYVKREDVLKILSEKNAPWNGYVKCKELPAEDVHPVAHGKWVTETDGWMFCSECGNSAEVNGITGEFMESPYCSECGARMDGEEYG